MLERMLDRRFTEVDLRLMLEAPLDIRRDVEPGRWLIVGKLGTRRWEIVLEPEVASRLLLVVTAYPVD